MEYVSWLPNQEPFSDKKKIKLPKVGPSSLAQAEELSHNLTHCRTLTPNFI